MAGGAGGDNEEDDNAKVNMDFIYTFMIIEGLIVLGSLAAAVLQVTIVITENHKGRSDL
mgnify:CR=1 FL=1